MSFLHNMFHQGFMFRMMWDLFRSTKKQRRLRWSNLREDVFFCEGRSHINRFPPGRKASVPYYSRWGLRRADKWYGKLEGLQVCSVFSVILSINLRYGPQNCGLVWFGAKLDGVWCMTCLYIFGETQRCTMKPWLIRSGYALPQQSRACSWVDWTYAMWIQSCKWVFS